jgi:hypothetical protein
MTVYVVPCGVSILDGLIAKTGQEKGPPSAKPGRLVKNAADLGCGVIARPDEQVARWWVDKATANAKDALLTAWDPRVLSAETSTLAASSGLGPSAACSAAGTGCCCLHRARTGEWLPRSMSPSTSPGWISRMWRT